MPLVKEAQVKGHAGEARLADAEQDAQRDEHRIRHGDGLQRCRQAPAEHEGGDVDVRGDDLPQERHPLKGNVRDVKGRERPLVPVVAGRAGGLQVLVHAGDARVADICGSMTRSNC